MILLLGTTQCLGDLLGTESSSLEILGLPSDHTDSLYDHPQPAVKNNTVPSSLTTAEADEKGDPCSSASL